MDTFNERAQHPVNALDWGIARMEDTILPHIESDLRQAKLLRPTITRFYGTGRTSTELGYVSVLLLKPFDKNDGFKVLPPKIQIIIRNATFYRESEVNLEDLKVKLGKTVDFVRLALSGENGCPAYVPGDHPKGQCTYSGIEATFYGKSERAFRPGIDRVRSQDVANIVDAIEIVAEENISAEENNAGYNLVCRGTLTNNRTTCGREDPR